MRIALTSPYAHPEVRRGAERYLAELGGWLAARGHDVTVVTTTSGPTRETVDGGVRTRFVHRGRPFGVGRLRVDDLLRTVAPVARGVRSLDPDVIQCHHYVDACGVRVARGRRRVPYVLWLPGAPPATALGGRPLHRAAFRLACAGAARVHTLSRYAARTLADGFGVPTFAVPPGVQTSLYAGANERGDEPTVLCTAAAEDPRKRVESLVRAFPLVLKDRPAARLVLAPARPEGARRLVDVLDDDVRSRVEIREGLDPHGLAAAYRAASVTVLPSLEEAFGLVLVESLAAGTPVVGTADGAIPEVVDDPATGRLFEPDDVAGLAAAIVDTIDLAADPTTAGACRRSAARWDWDVVGPQVEAIYGGLH